MGNFAKKYLCEKWEKNVKNVWKIWKKCEISKKIFESEKIENIQIKIIEIIS